MGGGALLSPCLADCLLCCLSSHLLCYRAPAERSFEPNWLVCHSRCWRGAPPVSIPSLPYPYFVSECEKRPVSHTQQDAVPAGTAASCASAAHSSTSLHSRHGNLPSGPTLLPPVLPSPLQLHPPAYGRNPPAQEAQGWLAWASHQAPALPPQLPAAHAWWPRWLWPGQQPCCRVPLLLPPLHPPLFRRLPDEHALRLPRELRQLWMPPPQHWLAQRWRQTCPPPGRLPPPAGLPERVPGCQAEQAMQLKLRHSGSRVSSPGWDPQIHGETSIAGPDGREDRHSSRGPAKQHWH